MLPRIILKRTVAKRNPTSCRTSNTEHSERGNLMSVETYHFPFLNAIFIIIINIYISSGNTPVITDMAGKLRFVYLYCIY